MYLHRDDLFLYEAAVQQGAMFGFKVRPQPPIDVYYDLTPVCFGDYEVRVHHTPGHCPGGVCLQVGPKGTPGTHLFVGDTLFAGSIGRTDLPGGDYATLLTSITTVLYALGDNARVYPGHGPPTTIGEQRRSNYALQPMSKDAFVDLVTADQPDAPSYFTYDAVLNSQERPTLDETLERVNALTLDRVLALQTAVIVGGNLKLIPLTGVTLPFVSYGRSSLFVALVAAGILVSVGQGRARSTK